MRRLLQIITVLLIAVHSAQAQGRLPSDNALLIFGKPVAAVTRADLQLGLQSLDSNGVMLRDRFIRCAAPDRFRLQDFTVSAIVADTAGGKPYVIGPFESQARTYHNRGPVQVTPEVAQMLRILSVAGGSLVLENIAVRRPHEPTRERFGDILIRF